MLVPLLLLALAAAPGQSRDTYRASVFGPNANALVEQCRSAAKPADPLTATEQIKQIACSVFISGVLDGAQLVAEGDPHLFPICFPPGFTREQLVKIIVKYGDDHPEKLNNEGSYIIMAALMQAFPCPAKP
jgi:Rap1a immunity proteins